jgi:hypothetical protein
MRGIHCAAYEMKIVSKCDVDTVNGRNEIGFKNTVKFLYNGFIKSREHSQFNQLGPEVLHSMGYYCNINICFNGLKQQTSKRNRQNQCQRLSLNM